MEIVRRWGHVPDSAFFSNNYFILCFFKGIISVNVENSIECRKTKPKVNILTSHRGHRQSIENLKQIRVPDVKCRRVCASKSKLVLVLLLIGLQNSMSSFLSQSLSMLLQNKSKCKSLLTLKWKPLHGHHFGLSGWKSTKNCNDIPVQHNYFITVMPFNNLNLHFKNS